MDSKKLKALRTLKKELDNLKNEPIYACGVTAGPVHGDDVFHWRITMLGPKNTPYEGGLFELIADFPDDYPEKGPKIRFLNKMYHCNVNNNGNICINTLSEWKPGTTMIEALSLIFALFFMQNPDSAFDCQKANLYKQNKAQFDKNAKEFTLKYANPSLDFI